MTEQSAVEIKLKEQFTSALSAMQIEGSAATSEHNALPRVVREDVGSGDFKALAKSTCDFLATIPGVHLSPKIREHMGDVRHIVGSYAAISAEMTHSNSGSTDVSITFPDHNNPFGHVPEVSVSFSRIAQGKRMNVDLHFNEAGDFIRGSIGLGTIEKNIGNVDAGIVRFDSNGVITEDIDNRLSGLFSPGMKLNIPSIVSAITEPKGFKSAPDVESIIQRASL